MASKGKARPALKMKQELVARLVEKLKKAKVIALADLRELPDRQFGALRKKLKGKAEFVVAKNSLIVRAIEKSGKGKELLPHMKSSTALILTELNPFELYKFVKKARGKAAAKPGQIAPFDLVVPAGETALPPGPVLTELKNAKIQAQIQGGKVVIAKDSTVAKKGEKINELAAKALQKLGIEPFTVGMNVVAALEGAVVYMKDVMDIDEDKFMADLVGAYRNALNLSVEAGYPTKQNIEILVGKAYNNAKNLAVEANIYEKEVIGLILAKARRAHDAIAVNVKFDAPAPAASEQAAAPTEAKAEEKSEDAEEKKE